jgi:hypothetical protein
MNIAGLAIDRRAITMTRTRASGGGYNADGEAVPGVASAESIKAVIQPVKGNQLMDMPEGIRTEAGWICWSRSSLAVDDIITHKGIIYRVLFDWPRDEGVFYRAALGRKTP